MALDRRAFGRGVLAAGAGLSLARPARAQSGFSLKVAAARKGLIYGAALEPEDLDDHPDYKALVQEQCALIVPMNVMKWYRIRDVPNGFTFERADRFMALAAEMGMKVHAHNLLWHEALPAWFPKQMTRDQAVGMLEEHIATVVGRYRGRIGSWDVVCEGVMPDGYVRNSPWFKAIGPEYFDMAFRAAHAADPKAILGIEDYGFEYDHIQWMVEKRAAVLQIIDRLQKAKVPVHALGIQSQLRGEEPPTFGTGLKQFLRDLSRRGIKIYISELDVRDQHMVADVPQRDALIADHYRRYLDAVLSEPGVFMVNDWELSDRYSAKVFMDARPDGLPVRPLPFDADLKPKPAAYAMLDAFAAARRR